VLHNSRIDILTVHAYVGDPKKERAAACAGLTTTISIISWWCNPVQQRPRFSEIPT
jgi:hypothetical protein